MGIIRRLSEAVASQVAAGEVVERPASIVKELLENSLDAGATRLDVEYQRGGTTYLSITDDGHGMDREDAALCLERHATSKIRTGLDLERVMTFGFRGEALPSIASVSRFRLFTRERGAEAGTEVVVTAGKIESVRDSGEAEGTRIEVRSLFFNLPARKKFLRGERTEAAHIDQQFQTLALVHPDRRFSLRRDGRQIHLLAPAAHLADRVRDLLGVEFAAGLFPLEETVWNGITVRGLLGRPGSGRGDRSGQTLFVNGRAVVSPFISQPLRDAYGSGLARGMHPAAILFVSLDPSLVDCNVHPAKREVRFRDGINVREAVHESVRRALDQFRNRGIAAAPARNPIADHAPDSVEMTPSPEVRIGSMVIDSPAREERSVPLPEFAASPVFRVPGIPRVSHEPDLPGAQQVLKRAFRFIGLLADRYVLMEEPGAGLVLLDHRASQERLLFEQLLRRMDSHQAESQRLLLPAVVELAPKDFQWIVAHAPLLASAGLLVEPFGTASVKVDGVPPVLAGMAVADLLLRVADDCRLGGKSGRTRAVEEAIARSVARAARFPDAPRNEDDLHGLLDSLLACDLPYACPNGRPTMVHYAFSELDRKFGVTR